MLTKMESIHTLQQLFRAVQAATDTRPFFTDLKDVLQSYNGLDWSVFVHPDPQGLVKERVYYSHNLEIMLLSWQAGHSTLPHDHATKGCWLKVLEGELLETRYNEELQETEKTCITKGQISFMSNDFGYHSIQNNGSEVTWSLHVYSPPFHVTRYFEL